MKKFLFTFLFMFVLGAVFIGGVGLFFLLMDQWPLIGLLWLVTFASLITATSAALRANNSR